MTNNTPHFQTLSPPEGVHPADITIEIEDRPDTPPTPEIIALWDNARQHTPRLFNAPVLSLVEARGPTLRVRRDSYQRLTAQSIDPSLVTPPVRQLSVTGLLIARDHTGNPHALLGRRSDATRIYGGLWEFAPGGGIDAPPRSHTHLDGGDVFRQLIAEIREELDLPTQATADLSPGRILALAADPIAGSVDLIMRLDLPIPLEELMAHTSEDTTERWEYQTTRWIATDELPRFARDHSEALIPPALDLIHAIFGSSPPGRP